jgi:hypothetical protein
MIESGNANVFHSTPRRRNQDFSQSPIPLSVSPSSSVSSVASTSTIIEIDPEIVKQFSIIVDNWKKNSLTDHDKEYLLATSFSIEEYISITEEFSLRHGVQLLNNHVIFEDYPTVVHEITIGYIESVVIQAYPRADIMNTRSTSIMSSSFHEC